ITSTQALNEFSNVLTKKWKLPVTDIQKAIAEIQLCCKITVVDIGIVNKALEIYDKYSFSYYDSLMLASSLINGCKYILTEDMNDGQIIEQSLNILNIFK
ncbi:MAG: PIN domain-containing protein, partial [Candidatus Adiutrix sp.]